MQSNNQRIISFKSRPFINGLYLFKIGLFVTGFIEFSLPLNLLVLTALCLHIKWKEIDRLWSFITITLFIALFYHDSYLPDLNQIMNQKDNIKSFSLDYMLEFVREFINPLMILAVFIALACVYLLGKYLRMITVVYALSIICAMINPNFFKGLSRSDIIVAEKDPGIRQFTYTHDSIAQQRGGFTNTNLDSYLKVFYENESARTLEIEPFEHEYGADFNIVLLEVPGLSNDDLTHARIDSHPALRRFDIYLSNFFTVTTDAKENTIRLLGSLCGQKNRSALLERKDEKCQLTDALEKIGYQSAYLMSENYGMEGITGYISERSSFPGRDINATILKDKIASRDNEPMQLFEKYLFDLLRHPDKSFTYLNYSALLKCEDQSAYNHRLSEFLTALDRFMDELEIMSQNTLLIVVPGSATALHKDNTQTTGIRDIPSLRMCLGTAMIKFAAHKSRLNPINSAESLSYMALGDLIGRIIKTDAFNHDNIISVEALTEDLNRTARIGENEKDTFMLFRDRQFYKKPGENENWSEYVN